MIEKLRTFRKEYYLKKQLDEEVIQLVESNSQTLTEATQNCANLSPSFRLLEGDKSDVVGFCDFVFILIINEHRISY